MRGLASLGLVAGSCVLVLACAKDPGQADAGETTDPTGDPSETGDTDTICEGFDDEPLEAPRTITVTNARAEPVYLMTANDCTFNRVFVTGPAGRWPSGSCEPSCAAMISGQCGCAEACAAPQLLRVEPGGSYPIDWAYVLVGDEVPASCVDTDLCGFGECVRQVAPPDGAYTISVDVQLTPAACAEPGDPCACPPGEDWCLTEAFHEGPADLEVDFDTELPSGSLELVVD